VKKTIFTVITVLILLVWSLAAHPADPSKEYYPQRSQDTWVKLVNWLMEKEAKKDKFGNELYGHSFVLKDEYCTLSYNHSNGVLSMTIVQTADRQVQIIGDSEGASISKNRVINVLTMLTFNNDTIPDLAIEQEIVMGQELKKQKGMYVVVDAIPHGKVSPRDKLNFNKKLAYLSTWALWEVQIMEGIGFKMVIPEKKEKI